MRSPKSWLLGCTGLVLLGLFGCGVPVDRAPSALSKANVPFNLLAPSTPPRAKTSLPSPAEVIAVHVFFIGSSGRLVSVDRNMAGSQVSPPTVLSVLAQGPSQDEEFVGLQSAIPPQTTILGASVAPGGLATIDIGGTFGQLVGLPQVEAVAQIVFTSMSLSLPAWKVTGVTFQLDGQPVEVPTDSGAQVPVVNESEFPSLAPAPVAHPTGP